MNIYEQLKKDHETVKGLLDKLLAASGSDSANRSELIKQLRDELIPHARAEEAVLYNSLRDMEQSKDLVRHSYGEHMAAETLLRSIQATDKVDVNWTKGVEKLKDALYHHIAEEEGRIIPAAERIFSEEEAMKMGQAFLQLKPKVRDGSLMQNTLDMVVNLMPERLRQSLKRFATQPDSGEAEIERKVS